MLTKDLQRAIVVAFLRAAQLYLGRGQIDWNYKRQEIKPVITPVNLPLIAAILSELSNSNLSR